MLEASSGRQPVTELLVQWTNAHPEIGDRVVRMVYGELRRIAAREFRREHRNHTLQATALVHEAYFRLRHVRGVVWEDRHQFLGFAAHLMRRILVEEARRKAAVKRGGRAERVTLAEAADLGEGRSPDLVALDDALEALARRDRRKAAVVELRFFTGLTIPETAAVLGISAETVGREWRRAKAWLFRDLATGRGASDGH